MSFLAYFYDKIMSSAEQACLREWRQDLLKDLHGNVLEIGAGTGANLEFYPETIASIVFSEPHKHMRVQLEKNIASCQHSNFSISSGSAENIDAQDSTYDFVVSSLVCCSVSSLKSALCEMNRVLKPGGKLVFLEHVAAKKGSKRRRWQNLITPLWRRLMGNCHLNRETEKAIIDAGFEMEHIKRASMRKVISIVRPTIRGIAKKI